MCFIGFRCGPVSVVSSFSRNCLYTLTTRGRALCPALLQYLCVSYNLLHVLETVLGDTTNLLAVKLSDVPSWRSWSTYPGSIGSTVFYWHWPQLNAMLVKKKKTQNSQKRWSGKNVIGLHLYNHSCFEFVSLLPHLLLLLNEGGQDDEGHRVVRQAQNTGCFSPQSPH